MSQASQAYVHRPFDKADPFLAGLDADAAAELVTASADVVLILDNDGVIRDLALMGKDMMGLGCQDWIGKPWIQTVTVESKPKIEDLLGQPGESSLDNIRWRHVNHPMADRADLPLSYSVVQVHRKAKGKTDQVSHRVAFGRDLRGQVALQQRLVTAQQSMERDYWRLRHVETRYRLLFQSSLEAVLIVDAATQKIIEANPAAGGIGAKAGHGRGGLAIAPRQQAGFAQARRKARRRQPTAPRLGQGVQPCGQGIGGHHMQRQRAGSIVITASNSGVQYDREMIAYCTTKHAVNIIERPLARNKLDNLAAILHQKGE